MPPHSYLFHDLVTYMHIYIHTYIFIQNNMPPDVLAGSFFLTFTFQSLASILIPVLQFSCFTGFVCLVVLFSTTFYAKPPIPSRDRCNLSSECLGTEQISTVKNCQGLKMDTRQGTIHGVTGCYWAPIISRVFWPRRNPFIRPFFWADVTPFNSQRVNYPPGNKSTSYHCKRKIHRLKSVLERDMLVPMSVLFMMF